MRLVDKKYCWGAWQERENDLNESSLAGYAEESFLQRVLRYKGEVNDPGLEPQELYYGATYYGWEEVSPHAHGLLITNLIELGIAEDWRQL
jgi:hypothetical protein